MRAWPLLVLGAGRLHETHTTLWVASATLFALTSAIKFSVACNVLDISISISVTPDNPNSVSVVLPRVLSQSLRSSAMIGVYTGGTWPFHAGCLALFLWVAAAFLSFTFWEALKKEEKVNEPQMCNCVCLENEFGIFLGEYRKRKTCHYGCGLQPP